MKVQYISVLTIACAATIASAHAEELVSQVIHNYDQAHIGFNFLGKPVIGSNEDAYGFTTGVSSEVAKNLLVSLKGTSAWGKDETLGLGSGNLWGVSPSVGLILRFAENHVNLIPHVDYSYSEVSFSKYDGAAHNIAGGATLSLAKNDHFALLIDYTFGDNIAEDINSLDATGAHNITVGPTIRLTEKVGFYIRGAMKWLANDEIEVSTNPYAIMVGVEYHW
jgi:hypothetical protein